MKMMMQLRRAVGRKFFTTPPSGRTTTNAAYSMLFPGKIKISSEYGFGSYTWSKWHKDTFQWIFLSAQAAIFLGINAPSVLAENVSTQLSSDSDTSVPNITGLHKIEDGSVVSNIHTSKWRVFTDNGRDLFFQGKLVEAEFFFLSALQEAKDGFGERDPHVASACNNLAELYRVKKAFDKAEPLYLEAINILEGSFGSDDIRVGAALHNLGQFYLVQRKLEHAHLCYERALKIKRCVLGEDHMDYADTMYHLGTVMYLLGKEKDSEALIQDSIRIVEDGGQGESMICIKRLRYLAQIFMKSNRLAEAENVQRKILHIMELSKGWNSMDTVIAAEGLALTLQTVGNLKEAQYLLERCLDTRKSLLPEDHIQLASNLAYIARVRMLNLNQLRKTSISNSIAELDAVKEILGNSIRIVQHILLRLRKQNGNEQSPGVHRETRKEGPTALVILLQSLNALALVDIKKLELEEAKEERTSVEAENALRQCISAFKEFGVEERISNSPEVKAAYLSCLKRLLALLGDSSHSSLNDEIKRVEVEIKSQNQNNSL